MYAKKFHNKCINVKSKLGKVLNSTEYSKQKVLNQLTNSEDQTHQTIEKKLHILDFVQAFFFYIESKELNKVFKILKTFTYMGVV